MYLCTGRTFQSMSFDMCIHCYCRSLYHHKCYYHRLKGGGGRRGRKGGREIGKKGKRVREKGTNIMYYL